MWLRLDKNHKHQTNYLGPVTPANVDCAENTVTELRAES